MREETVPREMLYIADEVFFTGTAAEISPIRSIDRITIGRGNPGPVTQAIQQRFFDTINGGMPDQRGWLTLVYPKETARREPARASTRAR